jgi:hypothetical protein
VISQQLNQTLAISLIAEHCLRWIAEPLDEPVRDPLPEGWDPVLRLVLCTATRIILDNNNDNLITPDVHVRWRWLLRPRPLLFDRFIPGFHGKVPGGLATHRGCHLGLRHTESGCSLL